MGARKAAGTRRSGTGSAAGRGEPAPTAPDRFMLSALQSTHQHADAKAGILAAVQGTLVGTAGVWNRQAVRAWQHGGAAGAGAGVLLAAFVLGLAGGAGCLVLALWPRVLRPKGANRFSFVHLAGGTAAPASSCPATPAGSTGAEARELAETLRFLAQVALRKHRCLMAAVACTTLMGLSAGLFLALRPLLTSHLA